jgi:hypothetical protein
MQNVLVKMHSVAVLVIAGVLFGTPAMAFREEFMTRVNGERIAGSRVCFFPATTNDGFVKKFLSSPDVRCLSADSVIDLPAGQWNIFASNGADYVSIHPEFYEAAGEDPITYGRINIDLVPAARLDLAAVVADLWADEHLAVYFPNDSYAESPATMRPLILGETSLLIPADMTVVPIIVRDGVPVAAVGTFRGARGERIVAPKYRRSDTDVFAVIRLESADMRKATAQPPAVVLEGPDGTRVLPLLPIRGNAAIDRSLAIFRAPKAGAYRVTVRGPGWKSDDVDVTLQSGGSHMTPRPLHVHPLAVLSVGWSVRPATITAVTATEQPCGDSANERARKPTRPALRLLKCDNATTTSTCAVVEERAFRFYDGTGNEVFNVEAGRYAAEMLYGDIRAASEPAEATIGEPRILHVVDTAEILHGTVKRGTRRIAARLMFESGEALALEDGQFIAALSRPAAGTVTVHPCDGGEFYDEVLLEPVTSGSIDITIPENVLMVHVADATTGTPMKDIRVTAAPMKGTGEDDAAYFIERMTNANGVAIYRQVPAGLPLRICAADPGRAHGCVETDALRNDAEREVTIRLTPEARRKGTVVTGAPIVAGKVFIVSTDGVLSETARIGTDGTFPYQRKIAPGDYVVIVSASHPLFLAQPRIESDESVTVTMPQGARRAFQVQLSDETGKGTITLGVGGMLVPADAFAAHQLVRNRQNNLYGTSPLLVTDILETAPLTVILGPLARQDLLNRAATAVAFPRMPVAPLVTFSPR